MNLHLIDNHTHGSFGINFNTATYNEIKYVLIELYKKNIRGICPTLVGDSNENLYKQLSIFKKIRKEQLQNINSEALVLGVHLEGTFLSPDKSGIQNKKVFKKPTIENFKDITKDAIDIIKIVTIAPEEDINLIDFLNENNIKTQAGHSLSETLKNCKGTTHHFNAMPQLHHRCPTMTLEGLIRNDIYCEIIPDLIHTSKEMLNLLLKTKPKERILLISDSLPSSNFNQDIIFCNKKINKEGKDESGTLAGSNKTLDEICKNLLTQKILTEKDIIQMGFKNQINYLNLNQKEIDILNR